METALSGLDYERTIMKVKIGKYTSWFGPYQLAEKLMFWVPQEKDEYGFPHTADRVHKFGEWLAHGSIEKEPEVGEVTSWDRDRPTTWLYKFLLWIESKKKRKIEVHIDKWDTWSMDSTLAYIIIPMLKQLKEKKHGAPYVEMTDRPEHLQVYKEPEDHNTDKFHFEAWDWALDEMIWAFEQHIDDDAESKFWTGEHDFKWVKLEDGNSQMVRGENDTSHYDKEAHEAWVKRKQNGFMLFGKYYTSLWD